VAASSFVEALFPGAAPPHGVREIHRRYSPRTATVTLGADGAVGFDGGDVLHARGIRVAAADTTGAGDVFHAGFLFALLADRPFPEILSFSNAAAALSCRKVGGRASIPTLEEIDRIFFRSW
jgi:sulfofructose kinase